MNEQPPAPLSPEGSDPAAAPAPPATSEPLTGPSEAPPGMGAVDPAPGAKVPLDANDMRGQHFKHLFTGTGPLIATILFVGAAGVAGLVFVSPIVGLAAAGGAFLLLLIIGFVIATSRAESDFFKSYAQGHGLQLIDGRGSLPPMTPLLRRGDRRYTSKQLVGVLPGGVPGTLAHYTYEDSTQDSNGNQSTTYMHFTVFATQIQEFAPFMQELYAQRRVGFRFLDGAEDVFRKRQRVEHESEAVDKRYEIFCGAEDDMNRAVQVLAPTFLVWLQDHSPDAFAFECVAGMLVCNVKGHKKSAADLDQFCEGASGVAKRLREEALE